MSKQQDKQDEQDKQLMDSDHFEKQLEKIANQKNNEELEKEIANTQQQVQKIVEQRKSPNQNANDAIRNDDSNNNKNESISNSIDFDGLQAEKSMKHDQDSQPKSISKHGSKSVSIKSDSKATSKQLPQPQALKAKPTAQTTKEELQLAFQLFADDATAQKQPEIVYGGEGAEGGKEENKKEKPDEDNVLNVVPKTKFHMPKAPLPNDPKDTIRFKEEMLNLFCSFEPHGSISDAVVNRFKANPDVLQPPTIQNLISDISENTSYKDEKMRFLKQKKEGKEGIDHFGLNISQTWNTAANGQMKNFSLMNDLGDILLQYGKQTGFKCILPPACIKSSYAELCTLFEKQLPRCAFGITVNMQGMMQFCKDIHMDTIFQQAEMDTLFFRAVFCQNKYILDYVELNPQSRAAQTKKVDIVSFDFLEYSNELSTSKKPDFNLLAGGTVKHLCYIGFLQFIYIMSTEIIKKFRSEHLHEIPTLAEKKEQEEEEQENEDEQDNIQKNYQLAQKNASYKRVTASIRDPFAKIQQYTKIDDQARVVDNCTYSAAWKTAYAFGCFMDCYVLRFAKRYGINLKNEFMEKNLTTFDGCIKLIATHQDKLKQMYIEATHGKRVATSEQLYKMLQKTTILEKISKNFLFEYLMRNYSEYDNNFVPVLLFEEFFNCLFIAANCAFCIHPYIQYLKTPAARLEYAIKKGVGIM